jgi:hypothetical protein
MSSIVTVASLQSVYSSQQAIWPNTRHSHNRIGIEMLKHLNFDDGPMSSTCHTCERQFDYPMWFFGAPGSHPQYGSLKSRGSWICDVCGKGFCSSHGNLGLCIPCFSELPAAKSQLELRDCGPTWGWPQLITFYGISPNYPNRVMGRLLQCIEELLEDPGDIKFVADEALQGVPMAWQLKQQEAADCRTVAKELVTKAFRDNTERAVHALFSRKTKGLDSWGLSHSRTPLDLLEPLDLIHLICEPTGRQLTLDELSNEFLERGFEIRTEPITESPLSVEYLGRTLRDGTEITVRGELGGDDRNVKVLPRGDIWSPMDWSETIFLYICDPDPELDLEIEFPDCFTFFYYFDRLSESPDIGELRDVLDC